MTRPEQHRIHRHAPNVMSVRCGSLCWDGLVSKLRFAWRRNCLFVLLSPTDLALDEDGIPIAYRQAVLDLLDAFVAISCLLRTHIDRSRKTRK